ncbi:MAG: hypothetical protein HQK49_12255 [Oligoflexia bacterium]|nr:hypothetical protein [Oligoflexia bacterium]
MKYLVLVLSLFLSYFLASYFLKYINGNKSDSENIDNKTNVFFSADSTWRQLSYDISYQEDTKYTQGNLTNTLPLHIKNFKINVSSQVDIYFPSTTSTTSTTSKKSKNRFYIFLFSINKNSINSEIPNFPVDAIIRDLSHPIVVEIEPAIASSPSEVYFYHSKSISPLSYNILVDFLSQFNMFISFENIDARKFSERVLERDARGVFEVNYHYDHSAKLHLIKDDKRYLQTEQIISKLNATITLKEENFPFCQKIVSTEERVLQMNKLQVATSMLQVLINFKSSSMIKNLQSSIIPATYSKLLSAINMLNDSTLKEKWIDLSTKSKSKSKSESESLSLSTKAWKDNDLFEKSVQQQELGNLNLSDLQKMYNDSNDDEKNLNALYLKFKALLYLYPQNAQQIAEMMEKYGENSKIFPLLSKALSTVGNESAQIALQKLIYKYQENWKALSVLIPDLGLLKNPSKESELALRETIKNSNNPNIITTSSLSLGIMANSLKSNDPSRGEAIVEGFLNDYSHAKTLKEKRLLLSVLGNTGSEKLLPMLTSIISLQRNPELLNDAIENVRLINNREAISLLNKVIENKNENKVKNYSDDNRLKAIWALSFKVETTNTNEILNDNDRALYKKIISNEKSEDVKRELSKFILN